MDVESDEFVIQRCNCPDRLDLTNLKAEFPSTFGPNLAIQTQGIPVLTGRATNCRSYTAVRSRIADYFLLNCNIDVSSGRRMNPAFRSSLPLALRIHLVDSEKGTVIGPFLTDRGWVLVLPEAVQPTVFDRETAEAVGQRLFKHWLDEKLRSTAASFPLLELSQIARQFGLQADAVRVRVDHLVDVNLHAIAHLTDGGYLVLYQMGAELVIVGDPANGIHKISRPELSRIWSGYLLLVRPAVFAYAMADS